MKTKRWWDRPYPKRCFAFEPDMFAGRYCLREGGHDGPHVSPRRTWSDGNRTSQPIQKKQECAS